MQNPRRNAKHASDCTPGGSDPAQNVSLPVIHTQKPPGAIRKSRTTRWRAAVLIGVHVLIIAHVAHWLIAGETLSPVEPSESMFTLERGELNAGFIFFAAALVLTLIFGRFVCGWGCHVVALQDLCLAFLKRVGLRPRPLRSRLLMLVPLGAALYMFVWPSVKRLLLPEPQRHFPTWESHLVTADFWATFPPWYIAIPFLGICGFATVYFLGAKGFCTYGCPYGGFFGLIEPAAIGRIRVTDACAGCGHCTATCTSNVRVHAEVRDYGMVVDPGCMKCLDCVSVCPNDALYFGFGKPRIAAGPRVEQPRHLRPALTWGEELLIASAFLLALLGVRGAYGMIPFLMALGVAGLVAFAVLQLVRLQAQANVSLPGLRLKATGRLTGAGWGFVTTTAIVLLLVAHSGFINYHAFQGGRAYARTAVDEAQLLGEATTTAGIPDDVSAAALASYRHLAACERWGLLPPAAGQRMQLAWVTLVLGRQDEALARLEALARKGDATGDAAFFAGRLKDNGAAPEEALTEYRRAMTIDARHVQAAFDLGVRRAGRGNLPAAIALWSAVLDHDATFAAARHNLAGAYRAMGQFEEAVEQYRLAIAADPDDAETHLQLAVTLTRMGRAEEASAHIARAIEIDPRYRTLVE